MPELVKEQVFLDHSAGSEEVQIMLEGDIIVPDTKPDMAQLLQTDERVTIERTEASADRINYVGLLNLTMLYAAKDQGNTVHSIHLTRPLDDFINIEGATKDVWVRTKAEIVNIDYRTVNDRKINYRAIIRIVATAEQSNAHDIIVHIHDVPENQLLKSTLNVNRTIDVRLDRFQVKDQISLASSKPSMREILHTSVSIANREARVANGRVQISGLLIVATLYRGDAADSILELVESEMPFNGPIDIAGARDDMMANVALQVLDCNASIRPDEDGEDRIIDIEITIGAEAKVYCEESINTLEDAYSTTSALTFEKTPISYPRLVCQNRNQAQIREAVSIPQDSPGMLQNLRIKGLIHMDEVRVLEDKVIVEGAINTDLLYVAESDATPLASFQTVIPYRQVIEAKGAQPGMQVSVDATIDSATTNMQTPHETEVKFQLTFSTQVVNIHHASIISDVQSSEFSAEHLASQSSMTVYVVQPGDSLWKIAKKYNTSLDELVLVNELENGSKLSIGQKLLLLKHGV